MLEQAATLDPERRRALFNDVQRILAENLPVLYFAAPRMYYAHSARLCRRRPVRHAPQCAVERGHAERARGLARRTREGRQGSPTPALRCVSPPM